MQTRRQPRQAIRATPASTQSTSCTVTMARAETTAGITAKPRRAIVHVRQVRMFRRDSAAGLPADRLAGGDRSGLSGGLGPSSRVTGRSSADPIIATADARGGTAVMSEQSMARATPDTASSIDVAAIAVSTTMTTTAAVAATAMTATVAAHQPVEPASGTAENFVDVVNIIFGVMAVRHRWCHVGPAGGEVVRVHLPGNRVLKEHSVRPSRSRHYQTQPEGRCQCQRECDPSSFSENHGLSLN